MVTCGCSAPSRLAGSENGRHGPPRRTVSGAPSMKALAQRRESSPERGRRGGASQRAAKAKSRTAVGDALRSREALTPESAITLQREAGNAAVVTLLERDGASPRTGRRRPASDREQTLQRDELKPADDPQGYTKAGGVKNVSQSGMTRVEVTGLKYGVKFGHQAQYKNWRGNMVDSFESQMTKESPE